MHDDHTHSPPVSVTVPWSGKGHLYSEAEIDVVVEAMRNADGQTQGVYLKKFEKDLEVFHGTTGFYAMTSCTAALDIAAVLARLEPGDEVIIPAHTFAATAIPFCNQGVKVVWADIDPETFVVSVDQIEPLITEKTKVIVVVHLYGLVCDMGPILRLAKDRGVLVVEDAAQAIGAKYNGRAAGTLADFGCFSFHSHKNITTLGEGGALYVKDMELARKVRGLRHNGTRPYEDQGRQYWIPAMSNIEEDLPNVWPRNYCLGEAQCALGSQLITRLTEMNEQRRKNALFLRDAFADIAEIGLQRVDSLEQHSFHLFPVRCVPGTAFRDKLIDTLFYKYGIKSVVQYYPLYRYPLFYKKGHGSANCPETDKFFDEMISLPFHHHLSPEQLAMLADTVVRAVKELS